jgi:uncharacterized protein
LEELHAKRAKRLMVMLYTEWKALDNEGRKVKMEWSIMHMFTSSQLAKLYALKFNLDPDLCSIIATLHDIATIEGKITEDHDKLAKDYVLGAIQRYNDGGRYNLDPITPMETQIILEAITVHSDKGTYTEDPFVEMLKDVDSLEKYLHCVGTDEDQQKRSRMLLKEFGVLLP